ncbi:hypothetical protein [Streptomyces sp. P17]|uniref:hypothetical protein n=1 Tax=Streptomyces sp. P17 TaxID=3074716 RepID=UPI0028F431D9|nr:hypothetical protein [Streptomyces sp. P17]MDT9699681.1 hypothetical protein [Streptomyces sp. P17]
MPLVGRPPGILRDREELRELLAAAVVGPGGDAHVVHGMGGCGKTALAYWLFTEAVRAHGRIGPWVNASEGMPLRAGMPAVAGDRGAAAGELAAAAAGQRAAADLVWHYLDHSPAEWSSWPTGVRCVRAHGVLPDSVAAGVPQAVTEVATELLEAAPPERGAASPEARSLLAPHALALLRAAPSGRTAGLAVGVARQVSTRGGFAGPWGWRRA